MIAIPDLFFHEQFDRGFLVVFFGFADFSEQCLSLSRVLGFAAPQCVLSNLFQIGLLALGQRVFCNGFVIIRHGVDKFFAFFIPIFSAFVALAENIYLTNRIGRIRVGKLRLKIRTGIVQMKIEGDPLCGIDFRVVEEVGDF